MKVVFLHVLINNGPRPSGSRCGGRLGKLHPLCFARRRIPCQQVCHVSIDGLLGSLRLRRQKSTDTYLVAPLAAQQNFRRQAYTRRQLLLIPVPAQSSAAVPPRCSEIRQLFLQAHAGLLRSMERGAHLTFRGHGAIRQEEQRRKSKEAGRRQPCCTGRNGCGFIRCNKPRSGIHDRDVASIPMSSFDLV